MLKIFRCFFFSFFAFFAFCAFALPEASLVVEANNSVEIDGTNYEGGNLLQHNEAKHLFKVERSSKGTGRLLLSNLTIIGDSEDKVREGFCAAIYNEGYVMASNCVFRFLSAPKALGSVYCDRAGAMAVFINCTFIYNDAAEGGAIAAEGSNVSFVNCSFLLNDALIDGDSQQGGGAVYADRYANLKFANVSMAYNKCSNTMNGNCVYLGKGSGIRMYNSVMKDEDCKYEIGVPQTQYGSEAIWGHLSYIGKEFLSHVVMYSSIESDKYDSFFGELRECIVNGVHHIAPFPKIRPLLPDDMWKTVGIVRANSDYTGFVCNNYHEEDYSYPIKIERDIFGDHCQPYNGAVQGNRLQDLIDATKPGQVCLVPPGFYDSAVVYKEKEGIIIRGENRDATIVDGICEGACLIVMASNVVVSSMTFKNGLAKRKLDGGGIFCDSLLQNVMVTNCVVHDCAAVATNYGGGLHNVHTVVDSLFERCGGDTTTKGGAVSGYMLVKDCVFKNNRVEGDLGAGFVSSGGALANGAENSCVFNCTFIDNEALLGGAIYCDAKNSHFENCIFTNNTAECGGTIVCEAEDSTIDSCFFANNFAEEFGGAMYLMGTTTVSRCTFDRNSTGGRGGAIYGVYSDSLIQDSIFTENTAKVLAGAVYFINKSEIVNCVFTRNTATQDVMSVAGAVYGGGLIKDCEFNDNNSIYGGAVAHVSTLVGCKIKGNIANLSGGGLYKCGSVENCEIFGNIASVADGGGAKDCEKIVACYIHDNEAVNGGGVAGTSMQNIVISSMIKDNIAESLGAGAYVVRLVNCDVIDNEVDGDAIESYAGASGCDLWNCLFYGNTIESVDPDHVSFEATEDLFYDAMRGNYHLSVIEPGLVATISGSKADCEYAIENQLKDIEGVNLVNMVGGTNYYYAGCYAYVPFKIGGTVVTGPEDSYPDNNLLTSLREAVDAVRKAGDDAKVTFSEDLFDENGEARLNIGKAQIEVDIFTNRALVVEGPADKRVVLDGGKGFRAFRVHPGNELELSNLTFEHFLGTPYGVSPQPGNDGGAILNYGTLWASDCAFRECQAGNSARKWNAPVGNGGAVATMGSATSILSRVSCDACVAASGGALYVADNGTLTLSQSTITGCKLLGGNSVLGAFGGAIYQAGGNSVIAGDTIVNNASNGHISNAGGVFCSAGQMSIVDSIILNNTADDVLCDLGAKTEVNLINSIYGVRNEGYKNIWNDTDVVGRVNIMEVLSSDIAKVAEQNVKHSYYPLLKGILFEAISLHANEDWSVVATDDFLIRGTSLRAAKKEKVVDTDQFLQIFSLPIHGAVDLYEESSKAIDPKSKNKLEVCEATTEALNAVLTYAGKTFPDEDGNVVVTFAKDVAEITLTSQIKLAEFEEKRLIIQGPVTLKGNIDGSLFDIAPGMNVTFRDIVFDSNHAIDAGGAIWCESSTTKATQLMSENCTFSNLTADYGGAVCIDGMVNTATFMGCKFEGNTALEEAKSVYIENTNAKFIGCEFSSPIDEEIVLNIRVKVEHTTGADYFYTASEAFEHATAGDLVVLVSSNLPKNEDLAIPNGISLLDETGNSERAQEIMAKVLASMQKIPWITPVVKGNLLTAEPNELARPTFDENEKIDFTSDVREVFAVPGNVYPYLWYGLAFSDTFDGEYRVAEGNWVQADANGKLPTTLRAPKVGKSGFYKVFVSYTLPDDD